ncbi:MAG TPA: glycosyltransferase family 39 protein [Gemmataceae bacterium]|jgi:4-amino-4-deoxy-L-arabinose transferase-like glycosyltransferase
MMRACSFPYRLVMAVLLAVHALLLLYSIRCHFATRNEVAHVPAGISCWQTGTFSLYRVNPPLGRMLAVLPVLAAQPNTDFANLSDAPGLRQEWDAARRFADANARNYMNLIYLARLAGVVWSLLGGWLVYRWAGELYGRRAGLLGLTLWCFGPNILAHAQLVTPDMPATVAGLAATYTFWCYLRRGTWRAALLAGLLLGVAQLTKFTLLVLYPVWALLGLLYGLDANNHAWRAVPPRVRAAQGLCIVLLSLLVLNAGYAFDGSGTPLDEYQFVSRLFNGMPAEEAWLTAILVPLPKDYLRGLDLQRRDFEGRMPPSFLAGEWRQGGWWYYYLYALAVKVPLGTLGLVLWSLVLFVLRRPTSALFLDELTLWLPALAVLVLVSSQTGFNHHMRYMLPMFPFVLIAAAKLAYYLQPAYWKRGLVVLALLLWSVGSSLVVYPHSLSYFNEFAGGPDNGHRHLLDSNIDWGQDLLYLKDWVEAHPEASSLGLAYFNYIDYRVCGAAFASVPPDPPSDVPPEAVRNLWGGPHPGYFAVDLHSLKADRYKYFERFQPIAKAGYSIFIYHLTPEQANQARREMGLAPLATTSVQK